MSRNDLDPARLGRAHCRLDDLWGYARFRDRRLVLVREVWVVMIEPSGDLRALAAMHRQMYEAWTQAGFTEDQAMSMMNTMIAGAFNGK